MVTARLLPLSVLSVVICAQANFFGYGLTSHLRPSQSPHTQAHPSAQPCAGSANCRCPHVEDNGFYSKNFKPQSNELQDIADKCIKIDDCTPIKDSRYRQYDGACNNLNFPMWGVTNSGLVRFLAPAYSDGVSKPKKAVDGSEMPNARKVRLAVLKDKTILNKKVSYLFTEYAQYISHDTSLTSEASGNLAECCDEHRWPKELPPNCTSTRVSEDDEFYSKFGVTCLPRLRQLTTADFGCQLKFAQQITTLSHYIDNSPLYGSTKEAAHALKSGHGGKLQVTVINNKIFPKSLPDPNQVCDIHKEDRPVCFAAGDFRVNENPGISILVIMFTRFHNHVASILEKLNPQWSDEVIFEETRRITTAVEIFIVRKEFLHLLIGREFMAQGKLVYSNVEYDDNYDPFLNPSTTAEFLNCAYRGGHSLILESLKLQHEHNKTEELVINEWLNRPSKTIDEYGPIMRSSCTSPTAKQDKYGSFQMNNLLFHGVRATGGDLETTSIERQRAAGLPGYCDYMEKLLGEPKIESWDDLKKYMPHDTIEDMKKVYKHVQDLDVYVAGVSECPVGDSMYGKLFTTIITEQFARWLRGDRYSPTLRSGPGKFTLPQLKELNKMSMAYLLCNHGEQGEMVPASPFELPSKMVPCKSLPEIEWNAWESRT